MVDDVTLAPETYKVLELVTPGWLDVDSLVAIIAAALELRPAVVRKRLHHLRELGLIERRRRETITPYFEFRKIAKV